MYLVRHSGSAKGGVMAVAVCFLKGTRIWTPHGERRVEDLRISDLVVTSSGEAKPIQWVWGRRFERRCGQKWAEEIAPIVVFLASDESMFATGQIYSVDGGMTI